LLTLTDDLTCLYNRRDFLRLRWQLLKLAHGESQNFLLFYCDVDNLKKINDSSPRRSGANSHDRRTGAEFPRSRRDCTDWRGEFVVMSLEATGRVEGTLLRRLEQNTLKAGASEYRYRLSVSVGVGGLILKLMSQVGLVMYEQSGSK
jgi:diguanylate cyclase (GGDEF)-like protein